MTKRHFELFAAEIRDAQLPRSVKLAQALLVARVASQVNKYFDRARFFRACGFENVDKAVLVDIIAPHLSTE